MSDYTEEDLQEALTPLASLMSKSEKAQQKLTPGTWQHSMLRDNLSALHIAVALISRTGSDAPSPDDLREAVEALSSMIDRTEKSQARFSSGTSQHTLQRNRLKALRVARAVVETELDRS